ncbi:nitrite reductase (NAD(P)H) small subunit, partial [Pseudonocardia adelaidensis]|uniref:nitrite reductase (NAD(P)H) small subunit n=1 Tax=Pseudonocardia adelaidensis TaxID=648754 RepID=UPI003CD08741
PEGQGGGKVTGGGPEGQGGGKVTGGGPEGHGGGKVTGGGPEGHGGGKVTGGGKVAVRAIGNVDPFSGAAVLSRGIVGDRGGVPVVASPVYKQAFSLVTGECLDDPGARVPVYPVRIADGWLQVGLP